jgi:hypothetical protein
VTKTCLEPTEGIRDENGLETSRSTSDEIVSLYVQPVTSVEYGPQTWLVQSQEFRAMELDLQNIYAGYGVETWLEHRDEIREIAIHILQICVQFRHQT